MAVLEASRIDYSCHVNLDEMGEGFEETRVSFRMTHWQALPAISAVCVHSISRLYNACFYGHALSPQMAFDR